ncbi:MAG: sulfide/dihydroorotate dehydrogenase-like FAD/NAD-binding protein [Candidatus Omnitrophica bacterium COP1]|nr:sulfide/dihydroorotate dehydrogenase-like FAD/NAD-binding protein [Candidatus Omnitrophica bacterium COP1]
MIRILTKKTLVPKIKEYVVEAPLIARKARPGNFVLVRVDPKGERIPLTIADSDNGQGTITLVVQEIGKTTTMMGTLEEGAELLDLVGPLGKDREAPPGGQVIGFVSGGLGVAPMYPQTKACYQAGNRVISILGARNKDLLFWMDRIEAISHETYIATDDGSFGIHAYAAQVLEDLIQKGTRFDEVISIGPVPHMKACTNVCKKHGIPVVVSLNPIMVDGTGMCGGCRVTVHGQTYYACVDGPEFDGSGVDFDELSARQRTYLSFEADSLLHYQEETEGKKHQCALNPAK